MGAQVADMPFLGLKADDVAAKPVCMAILGRLDAVGSFWQRDLVIEDNVAVVVANG